MPRATAHAALAAVCLLATAVAAAAARRPAAYPHLQQDWDALRLTCEEKEGAVCAAGAELENCVRR